MDEAGEVVFVEEDADRFMEARNGDHLMCPFQCDECHFWNIQGQGPDEDSWKDRRLLMCIRRASLDALWAREPSTVAANL